MIKADFFGKCINKAADQMYCVGPFRVTESTIIIPLLQKFEISSSLSLPH